MKVVAYGDSFTAGLGTDRKKEEAIFANKTPENINKLRNDHQKFIINNSFPKYFADKLGVPFKNSGDIGCNNLMIINKVIDGYIKQDYKKGDLVLVTFTSTLRNKLPFTPDIYNQIKITGIQWSIQELINNSSFQESKEEYCGRERTNYWSKEPLIDKRSDEILSYFIDSYPKYFTENLYDEVYIDFFNQNMILLLQKFFNDVEVDYIFIDAFETSIRGTNYDKTDLIDKSKYWGYGKESIYSLLRGFNDPSYLEEDGHNIHDNTPKHPSRKGHKAFAKNLFKFYKSDKS